MSPQLAPPAATAAPEKHADWLEASALRAADKNASFEEMIRAVRVPGGAEALPGVRDIDDETDSRAEVGEAIATAVFNEIDDRHVACGGEGGGYPYRVEPQIVQAKRSWNRSTYAFLLLLSLYGKDAGPTSLDGDDLFEEVCTVAAHRYFCGEAGGGTFLFGFPRRMAPQGFAPALNELCAQMAEGGGSKARPTRRRQKDAKLDLAAWRGFPDGRPGKLLGFGQCATGGNWSRKLTELQPHNFAVKWLHEYPAVLPIRLFFVPFRVERAGWYDHSVDGGILFDRCRIAAFAPRLPGSLQEQVREWTRHVLQTRLMA